MLNKLVLCSVLLFIAALLPGLYLVNFEGPAEIKTAYASGTVNLSGLNWDLTEALIGTLAADFKNGLRSARLRGYASSSLTMLEDKSGGLGTLTFQYRRYGTDAQVDWLVQYSVDQGLNWTQIGSAFTAPASDEVQTFSQAVNVSGDLRLRIKRATPSGASNNRLNIDDITLTDYVSLAQINVSGSLSVFATEEGTPSPAQSYQLSGTALAGEIQATAPSGFELSADGGMNYEALLTLPASFEGSILVRLTGTLAGTFGGYIAHSSPGAATVNLPAVGTVSGEETYASDLFFSEYVEGSSYNKAIEIFNGTGSSVSLSDYKLELYSNGAATPSLWLNLSGDLAHGEVLVVAHPSASTEILAVADLTSNVANFNGDDALALSKISTGSFVDIFGRIGDDPGTAWTGDGGYSTLDKTLVRKPAVTGGISVNPGGTGSGAFSTLTTEWDLYGIDSFADLGSHDFEGGSTASTPPTVQASNIICYPTSTTIALEWTPGNGARRIVKINSANSFTTPTEGSNPTANPVWAGLGEQVVFNGATQIVDDLPFNGCEVTGLSPNSLYWFRIYEYNGSGSNTRYLAAEASGNPVSATTLNAQGGGYYAGVSGYGAALKTSLHTLIKNTHTTQYSYSALVTQIPYTDEDPDNPDNVIEIYTGWSVPKAAFGNDPTDWNREHTWSKSHGDFGDVPPAGTDLHHLRPCDSTVNTAKSNRDFDYGVTPYNDASPPSGYTNFTGCYTASNAWEPRTEDKGDVARMIMYMAVRYDGDDPDYDQDLELVDYVYSDAGTTQPNYGKLATLLNWHVLDPPDARELQRHERIAERQGNRNPFVDVPVFAHQIWSPVPVSAYNVTTTGFSANWTTPISATGYYLQLATDSLFMNVVTGYDNLDVGLSTNRSFSGLAAGGSYYLRLRSFFLSGYSMYSPFLAVSLAQPAVPAANLTAGQNLEEINLDGAELILTLDDTAFSTGNLLISHFSLNSAPAGVSVQSVDYLGPQSARLVLAFTGTDFDLNYPSFSVTIAAAALTHGAALVSSVLPIFAHVETTASIALEWPYIRLTITPVGGNPSYRIFAATEPGGTFSEVSTDGVFDPLEPNLWRIGAALAPRRFFRVSAVLD